MEIEVVNYIKEARLHGLQDSEIKKNLLNAGWEAGPVEESFAYLRALDAKHDASALNHPDILPQHEPSSAPVIHSEPVHEEPPHALIHNTPDMVQVSQKSSRKWLWPVLAFVILAVLAAGGYYAYTQFYGNPASVWKKFTQTKASTIYQNNYKFSYSDPGSLDNGVLGITLKDIKLSLEGSAYVNTSDPSNPISKSDLQYTFSSGNTSFSTGFKYALLNKVLYLNVGENPLLRAVMSAASQDKQYDWIKIDFGEIEKASQSNEADYQEIQKILSPEFKSDLEKIWEDASIIKQDQFLGREKINGVTTLHYKNSVDKNALKALVKTYTEKFTDVSKDWQQPMTQADADIVNEVASQLIDKMEIKEFETWIGSRDFRLYKVHVVSNAPSYISLLKNAESSNLWSNNDAKRLADVRQMASALELYYNDHGGYPEGKDGVAQDITPTYIGVWPTAPAPSGTCTDYYNSYWYQPTGTKSVVNGKTVWSSYALTTCFGYAVGGYSAGIIQLTPAGLENIPCPTDEKCVGPDQGSSDNMKKQVTDFVSKLDFSATINADVTYNEYGKSLDVQAPSEYYDILSALASAREKSRDAKRLADVRQLASALELYFNDKNQYPATLQDMTPAYIGIVPTPPTPNDGNCTPEQNNYSYAKQSGDKYTLTFCLGQDTGGYPAGTHTLSPQGIQ